MGRTRPDVGMRRSKCRAVVGNALREQGKQSANGGKLSPTLG